MSEQGKPIQPRMADPVRPEPGKKTMEGFAEFLKEHGAKLQVVRWNPLHTKIAALFAEWWSAQCVRAVLDEALSSGDGSYRP